MTRLRLFLAALVVATVATVAAVPATAQARTPTSLPWIFASQVRCMHMEDLGHELCAHLKVSSHRPRDLEVELTPEKWDPGLTLHSRLTIWKVGKHSFQLWNASSICTITDVQACEMDYWGASCWPGEYLVSGKLWMSDRWWVLNPTIHIRVR